MQVMTLSHNLRKESKWTKIKHAIKLSAFGLAYGRAGGDDESAKDFEILFNPRAPWPAYEKATPHLSGLYVYTLQKFNSNSRPFDYWEDLVHNLYMKAELLVSSINLETMLSLED